MGLSLLEQQGESATVSVAEHLEIIEKTIDFVDGRVPVIAGTGGNSTQEAIELTQTASRAWSRLCPYCYSLLQQTKSRGLISAFY